MPGVSAARMVRGSPSLDRTHVSSGHCFSPLGTGWPSAHCVGWTTDLRSSRTQADGLYLQWLGPGSRKVAWQADGSLQLPLVFLLWDQARLGYQNGTDMLTLGDPSSHRDRGPTKGISPGLHTLGVASSAVAMSCPLVPVNTKHPTIFPYSLAPLPLCQHNLWADCQLLVTCSSSLPNLFLAVITLILT